MSTQLPRAISPMAEELREKIISDPDMVLDDLEVMRALIAANERGGDSNVVDLRGLAMERLEDRLDRLEDTHRGVIAAAYENLAGTNLIHRTLLQLLEPSDFKEFMTLLSGEIAQSLRVDAVRLMLETRVESQEPAIQQFAKVLLTCEPGFTDQYITYGRNIPARQITLRPVAPGAEMIYGESCDFIHSEALMKLDFGPDRLPGLLIFGSEDPHMFRPSQGTDLLKFFADAFERMMRRWLG